MYGYLNFDIRRPATPWTACYFALPDAAAAINPKFDAARKKGVELLINMGCNDLDAESKKRLISQVYDTVKYLPDSMEVKISFEIHMALAHCMLTADRQTERNTRIAALLDPYFKSSPIADVQDRGEKMKALSVMVPDAAMNAVLRSQGILLGKALLRHDYGRATYKPFIDFVDDLRKTTGWSADSLPVNALEACYFGRAPNDQQDCLRQLKAETAQSRLQQWLARLTEKLSIEESDLLQADLGDTVYAVLESSTDDPAQDINSMVEVGLNRFKSRRSDRALTIVEATRNAIQAGVLFDGESAKRNADALAAYDLAVSRMELAMTVGRLRSTFAQPRKPAVPLQPTVSPPDIDPVHARSVEWLVQWIEGSDTKTSAPVRIDRRKVVKEEQTIRAKARKATQMSKEDQTKDEDLTEKDVDLVVQSGLSSTAEFFLRDIEETAVRAKHLNMEPRLLEDCMQYSDALNALSRQPITDEPAAIALLHKAEAAINELRANIKSVDVAASLRRKFAHFLNEALDREPLVYGKRHGGVIACPMREADWPWVHGEFHHRWLNVQRIEIDGHQVPLQPHQALALYVTGSSLSHYAFDVSVHLWIRKEGCKNSPTADNSAWMDNEAWLDTRIPCAVLHVPPST